MEDNHILSAIKILEAVGMPKAQLNDRSGLTLLALANLTKDKTWKDIENSVIGVTPIMQWCKENYQRNYAPNTRETFRRQTLHQLVSAGLVIVNPAMPDRPVNSPKTCYQIESTFFKLLQAYNTKAWSKQLKIYLVKNVGLREKYANERASVRIPVSVKEGSIISLSPGAHSQLIREIVELFAPIFTSGANLLYVGDTGAKFAFFDSEKLTALGLSIDTHGKMPDVLLYWEAKNWLILVESVTSHGPVDAKRHEELKYLFSNSNAGLVFVTAFPDKKTMIK